MLGLPFPSLGSMLSVVQAGLGLSHFESLTVPAAQDRVLSRENCSLGRFLTTVLLTLGSRTLRGQGAGGGGGRSVHCRMFSSI